MIYIEEIEENEINGYWEKIKYYISKFFKVIKKEELNNKIKYIIPKYKNKLKIVNKIIKNINGKRVVLDKKLMKSGEVKNTLSANNIEILDGTELYKYLILDTIKIIENLSSKKINAMEISIMANDIDSLDKMNILEISKIAKRVNIITNHINKFKKIEEDIMEEYGTLINLSDNKKKSLKKSDIILNFDMPEELINKYNINQRSIIINVNEKIDMKNKMSNGINIIDYDIDWDSEYDEIFREYKGFQKNILYESLLKNNEYVYNINKIKEDKIKIKAFMGIRGIISRQEFKILKKP